MGLPEETLYATLTGDPTVSGLLGDRIYPANSVPQDPELPLITYQRVSTVPVSILNGTTQLESARIQVSSWSDSYGDSKSVASAVKAALDGKEKIMFRNEVDRFDRETDLSFTVVDITIWND